MGKSRRNRSRRNRRTSGGAPQDVNDTSMLSPQKLSFEQGNQFADLTKNMHGGMGTYPNAVTDSVLPQPLHASARLVGLDQSFDAIKGMSDEFQGGARRRRSRSRKASRKSRKSRKASRKGRKASRKGRKGRKASRKQRRSRRQRGGQALGYAEVNSPGMLLSPDQTARAGLNPEWALAENPNSFTPKH